MRRTQRTEVHLRLKAGVLEPHVTNERCMREIKRVLIPRPHNPEALVRNRGTIGLAQENSLQKGRPQYPGRWPVFGFLRIKSTFVAFCRVEIRDSACLHAFPYPLLLRGPGLIGGDRGGRQYWGYVL